MKPATLIILLATLVPVLTLAGDTATPDTNDGTATAPGPRYQLLSAPVTAAGDTTDLQLQVILRLDTHTGRTWRLAATAGPARDTNTLSWIPIGEPNGGSMNLHPIPRNSSNHQQNDQNHNLFDHKDGFHMLAFIMADVNGLQVQTLA